MRQMVARANPLGIGIDVGWRFEVSEGGEVDVWWGNTKDETSLHSLVADAQHRLEPFSIDESVSALLDPPP